MEHQQKAVAEVVKVLRKEHADQMQAAKEFDMQGLRHEESQALDLCSCIMDLIDELLEMARELSWIHKTVSVAV